MVRITKRIKECTDRICILPIYDGTKKRIKSKHPLYFFSYLIFHCDNTHGYKSVSASNCSDTDCLIFRTSVSSDQTDTPFKNNQYIHLSIIYQLSSLSLIVSVYFFLIIFSLTLADADQVKSRNNSSSSTADNDDDSTKVPKSDDGGNENDGKASTLLP